MAGLRAPGSRDARQLLSSEARQALDELCHRLERFDAGTSTTLQLVAEGLPSILGTDRSLAYSYDGDGDQLAVDECRGVGVPTAMIASELTAGLARRPDDFLHYRPDRPDPRQRNRVLTLEELCSLNGGRKASAQVDGCYHQAGLDGDQLRVLVCDGPQLVAWVGAWRCGPFTRREKAALTVVGEAARRRLALERQLDRSSLRAVAFDAVLEAISCEAYLVRTVRGRFTVVEANSAGRSALAVDRATVEGELRDALLPGAQVEPALSVSWIHLTGFSRHALVLRRRGWAGSARRTAEAQKRWGLTGRQAQVLRLLVRGLSNKASGAELDCAVGTAELHVRAVLRKAEVPSRSALAAAFWATDH